MVELELLTLPRPRQHGYRLRRTRVVLAWVRAWYPHVRQWYHDYCERCRDSIPNVVPVDISANYYEKNTSNPGKNAGKK